MFSKHPRFASAVSLTEVVVAMAVLAIATLGGLGTNIMRPDTPG
jgi:prepilin-type N-terminal cleavage/methylation domain-containing protein